MIGQIIQILMTGIIIRNKIMKGINNQIIHIMINNHINLKI